MGRKLVIAAMVAALAAGGPVFLPDAGNADAQGTGCSCFAGFDGIDSDLRFVSRYYNSTTLAVGAAGCAQGCDGWRRDWFYRYACDNPTRINVSSFSTKDPQGFGLIQRDRDFASHQDIETRAELRPSAWIEPRGSWGAGHVELVEIPTITELNDNVVAFWVPDAPLQPGKPLTFAYALTWYGDDRARPPGGRTVATRRDRGTVSGGNRFVIDFDGEALRARPADQPPDGVVTAGPGQDAADLLDQHVVKNPATGGWRLSFQLKPKSTAPIELRAYLSANGDVLTETWSYALEP